MYWMSGTCMPSRNAVSVVQPNERKPPTSAAESAGRIRAGTAVGSTLELIEATKMPSSPVMHVESTQLMPARRSGEKPSTTAPLSFSAAARVARPKRVNRNSADSATVNAITSTATNSCSWVISSTQRSTRCFDTNVNGLTVRGVVAKRRMTIACSRSSSPTDATTLASCGAWRSGRKISRWMTRPSATQNSSDTASAAQNPIAAPNEIAVGQSGRSKSSLAWNQCTTPSTGASGLGNGGTKRSPSVRSPVYT